MAIATFTESKFDNPALSRVLQVKFETVTNDNGSPVRCLVILRVSNGAPVVEIVHADNDQNRVQVECRAMEDAQGRLAAAEEEIARMAQEIQDLNRRIAYITAPPLDYGDLVNIAMIQADGEINGWETVSAADGALYATRAARAQEHPQYAAIFNSCRSHYRKDKKSEEMAARFERMMTEFEKMSLDEQIKLDLVDFAYDFEKEQDAAADAAAAANDRWVAQGEIEADERAQRHEEEAGADPARRFLEEDMIHDHFAEQWAASQD